MTMPLVWSPRRRQGACPCQPDRISLLLSDNAGDGGHEHPTQTLCDLYSLRCERGRVRQLTVLLYGDLLYDDALLSPEF